MTASFCSIFDENGEQSYDLEHLVTSFSKKIDKTLGLAPTDVSSAPEMMPICPETPGSCRSERTGEEALNIRVYNNCTHPVQLWWCNEKGVQLKGSDVIEVGRSSRVSTVPGDKFVIRTKPAQFKEKSKIVGFLEIDGTWSEIVADDCATPMDVWPTAEEAAAAAAAAVDKVNKLHDLAKKADEKVEEDKKVAADEKAALKARARAARAELKSFAQELDISEWYADARGEGPLTLEETEALEAIAEAEVKEKEDAEKKAEAEAEAKERGTTPLKMQRHPYRAISAIQVEF